MVFITHSTKSFLKWDNITDFIFRIKHHPLKSQIKKISFLNYITLKLNSLFLLFYILGSGTGLTAHRNNLFSTYDRDNDLSDTKSCAESQHGAWWYSSCANANLNGDYNETYYNPNPTIYWLHLPGGSFNLQFTEMKIRPL